MSIARQIIPNGIAARAVAAMNGSALFRYDAACRALAEANAVDEVKDIRDKAEAMRAYAKQAKNKQLEIDASEIRFRAERRIGELMAAQKNANLLHAGGRPQQTGSNSDPVSFKLEDVRPHPKDEERVKLAEAGIDKHLADRARKYAAVPEQQFEEILADRRERIETENKRVTVNLMEAGHRVTLNTGENEWYTPDEYLDLARNVLGGFDLDPASCLEANGRVGAGLFHSEADSGLTKQWHGRVWMNPPYAQPLIAEFCDKLVEEYRAERVTSAIALTNDSTDTGWFHALAGASAAICFPRGRIRFLSPHGERGTPTQGQAFFYFGTDVDRFAEVFAEVGIVVEVRQ